MGSLEYLFIVLRNDGEIKQVVVSQIFHIVRVALGAIVALAGTYNFNFAVIVKSSFATDDKDDFAVAYMSMQARRGTWSEGRVHYLYVVICVVAAIQGAFATLEVHSADFLNFFKVYYHNFCL